MLVSKSGHTGKFRSPGTSFIESLGLLMKLTSCMAGYLMMLPTSDQTETYQFFFSLNYRHELELINSFHKVIQVLYTLVHRRGSKRFHSLMCKLTVFFINW